MHPSSKVNCQRLLEVKLISLLLVAALLLFTLVVTKNMLNVFFEIGFSVAVGLLVGTWVYFLGTGKVWEEWFWKKRL
ncbi:hypothetical protein HGA34_05405 [Candidatus Falkowbacteria bacterium]|nr:hypothetical protein [Candidatus Falkowbacteria bacterium]